MVSSHLGYDKTIDQLTSRFHWPNITTTTRKYISTCDVCQQNKSSTQPPSGLLQPLPVPTRCWADISTDLTTALPRSPRGFDAIFTVVDRLTKMIHVLPTHTSVNGPTLARLSLDCIVGFPTTIVSDWDPASHLVSGKPYSLLLESTWPCPQPFTPRPTARRRNVLTAP